MANIGKMHIQSVVCLQTIGMGLLKSRTTPKVIREIGPQTVSSRFTSEPWKEKEEELDPFSFILSAQVLAALASEILLKALIFKKTGSYKATHDLKKLFENLNCALDAGTKKRIRDLENEHKVDLGRILEEYKDLFTEWRYVYSYSTSPKKIELGDMEKALVILKTLVNEQS